MSQYAKVFWIWYKHYESALSEPCCSAGRAGRSSSRGSSTERSPSTNLFICEGSIKAQKLEMEAAKAEEAELEKAKEEKRARSANKKVHQIDWLIDWMINVVLPLWMFRWNWAPHIWSPHYDGAN